MWLSRRPASPKGASAGRVTLPGGAGFGGGGGAELREAPVYGPYGYRFEAPEGSGVLLLDPAEGHVLCGVRTPPAGGLLPGEVEISVPSGARIKLCQDGTIWLNGAHISKGGQFVPGSGSGD